MQKIIYKQSRDLKDEYHHKETNRVYQRIFGGIAWPGERPGFVVVVGEVKDYKPPYHAYVIAEFEGELVSELIRRCLELKSECQVSAFYGLIKDESNMHFLSLLNRQASQQHKPTLLIEPAPSSENALINYHINILLSRLSKNNKTLHLSPSSKLPGYLQELQATDLHQAKAKDYPAVAALGFVVSALTVFVPNLNPKPYLIDEERNQFDPLDRSND